MKGLRLVGRAGLVAVLLMAIAAPAVLGYAGQVAGQVTVTPPAGTLICNTPFTVSATILDVNGIPFDATTVTWSFKAGTSQTGDTISPLTSTTNASGVATTTVTLACIVGSRTILATAGNISSGAVLGITATGLPNTATGSGNAPAGTPLWALALAAAAVVAGFALSARQVRARR